MTTAEQALKVAPANREANRVLGIIYAPRRRRRRPRRPPAAGAAPRIVTNAIRASRKGDRRIRSARPIRTRARRWPACTCGRSVYDKAIPLLVDLVRQQPGWQDGPRLLAQAYAGAGRDQRRDRSARRAGDRRPEPAADAGRLLRAAAALGGRGRRLRARADGAPRNVELKTRYASGAAECRRPRQHRRKARDVLMDDRRRRRATTRGRLYLLSQADRRLGDLAGAEAAARRLIAAQNSSSPWGYYALAEALEERREYDAVVDALTPAVAKFHAHAGRSLARARHAAAASGVRASGARRDRQGASRPSTKRIACRRRIRSSRAI